MIFTCIYVNWGPIRKHNTADHCHEKDVFWSVPDLVKPQQEVPIFGLTWRRGVHIWSNSKKVCIYGQVWQISNVRKGSWFGQYKIQSNPHTLHLPILYIVMISEWSIRSLNNTVIIVVFTILFLYPYHQIRRFYSSTQFSYFHFKINLSGIFFIFRKWPFNTDGEENQGFTLNRVFSEPDGVGLTFFRH